MRLLLQSISFGEGNKIKSQYTCNGENISPALSVDYKLDDLKSFAVLFEDHDPSNKPLIHWILFNIPKISHDYHQNYQI